MNWRFFLNIGVSKQDEPIIQFAKRLFNLDIWIELIMAFIILGGGLSIGRIEPEMIGGLMVPIILFLPLLILAHRSHYTVAVIIKLFLNGVIFSTVTMVTSSTFQSLLVFTVCISALTFLPKRILLSRSLFLFFALLATGLFIYQTQLLKANGLIWSEDSFLLDFFIVLFSFTFSYKIAALMLLYQVSVQQNKVNYNRYQFLFDNSNQGLILLENGEIKETNQTLVNMFGYQEEELKHSDSQGNTPLAQLTNLINNLRYADNLNMERIIKNKQEQLLNTVISTRKIDTKNKDENYSIITFDDVTQQRLDEEDMRHKKFVIEMLQKNFPTIYYKFDKDLMLLESVGAALSELGLQENQVVGTNIRDMYADYPDIIEKHEEVKFKGFIQYDTSINLGNRQKYYTTRAFYDFESEIGIGLSFDVTDQKEQEQIIENNMQQLNTKNEELEKYIESNLQLENFAYIASHDLQSPIRTIISFSQLLKRSAKHKLDEREIEYLDFVVDASRNMKQLVEDLLTYSLVDSEKHQPVDFNLQDLLEGILLDLYSTIEEKHGEIIFDNIPTAFHADKTRIRQLFQNLMSNALKFVQPEEIPKISILCETKADHYYFRVSDNGIGIPKEFHEKIFLLFKKLHNNTIYKGTGIGLALVKKIIDQHHGKVWLESEEGVGTTFHFTIAK